MSRRRLSLLDGLMEDANSLDLHSQQGGWRPLSAGYAGVCHHHIYNVASCAHTVKKIKDKDQSASRKSIGSGVELWKFLYGKKKK